MPPKRTIITSPEPILAALYRQELIRLLLAREEQRTDRQWNRWSTEREWNTPPIEVSLEYGVEFVEDDELVEITPKSIRLRKRFLTESERKRAGR